MKKKLKGWPFDFWGREGGYGECKVLMSHESVSQIWKNKIFGKNYKIKHYFYVFWLLASFLPAQAKAYFWHEI